MNVKGAMDFVIITALEEERDAVLELLPDPRQLPPSKEDSRVHYRSDLPVTYSDGSTSTYKLIVLPLLGMGRVEAANATNDAIRRWRPRYVLLVGIAGGISDEGVRLGDVLISEQIIDYELQKIRASGPEVRPSVHRADPRLLAFAKSFTDDSWLKLVKPARPEPGQPERRIGPIATGDKVIAFREILDRLRTDWPRLIGVEMEAGGVASASFQASRPPGFFMIRSVSDLADGDKDSHDVAKWRSYVCSAAAAFTIGLLRSGPIPRAEPDVRPATRGSGGERDSLLIKGYLQSKIGSKRQKVLEASYVPLAGMTEVPPQAPLTDWEQLELLDTSFFRAAQKDEPESLELRTLETLDEAFSFHSQFAIVGKPGSGKSATLEHMLLKAAQRRLEEPDAPCPLLVNLAEWQEDVTDFEDLLAKRCRAEGMPLGGLDHPLLLLDGLNQIDADSYDRKALEIKNWLEEHPRAPVVLASRQQHYSAHRQLTIPLVRILPLDGDRIRRFVINFLGEQLGSKLLGLLGPAEDMASSSRDRLANNPLHLFLMCVIFKKYQEQVPSTRGELLRKFTSLIYERQEKKKGQVNWISAESLKESLKILAFGIVSGRRSTSIDEAWAAKRLKRLGTDLHELMRLGERYRLLSKSDRFFEFDHQLLLEYFAAEYLLDHLGQLDEYLPVPVFIRGKRVAQPFDDVLNMLIELEDVSRILEEIADRDPFQAADLLGSLADEAEVDPAVRETIVRHLMETFEHTNEAHGVASEHLVKLGSAAIESLQRLFETGHKKARRRAISTLSQISTLPALETVVDALRDRNRWVRRDAIQIMSSLDEGERCLMETFVRELAQRGEEEREAIAKSLLKCWMGHYDDLARLVGEVSGIEWVDEEGDGEPETTEEDEGPPESEPVLEEEDIDSSGRSLPFQVSDFEEAPSEQRVHRWLRSSIGHRSWPKVWSSLWKTHPGNPELKRFADRWLTEIPDPHPSWGSVWSALWRAGIREPKIEAQGRRWLAMVSVAHRAWGWIWHYLWSAHRGDAELERLGREWMGSAPAEHKAWGFIWPKLWEMHPKDVDLVRHGRRWLEEAPPRHQAWGFIWPSQWESSPGDSELTQLGRKWLAAVDASHPGWGLVWGDLWKTARDDEKLCRLAHGWLQHTLPHYNWGYVWSQVWQAHPKDPELEVFARSWLAQTPAELPLWGHPWTALWDTHPGDPELEALGRRWLSQAPVKHRSWGYIWPKLWERFTGDEELEGQGRRWLKEAPPYYEAWGFIWPPLREANPADDQLAELGHQWLRQASPDHGSWLSVWRMLWKTTPSLRDATMAKRGQAWLERTSRTNGAWPYTWDTLWQYDSTPELLEMGCRWLLEVPADHSSWYYVWQPLQPVASRRPEFVEASVRWLRATDEGHERWGEVSTKLADQGLLPGDLTEHIRRRLDLSRLDEVQESSDLWGRIWSNLWDISTDREELALRALHWLSGRTYGFKSWPFVWNRVYKEFGPGPDLVRHGQRWAALPSSLGRPGWALVWAGVIQSYASSRHLLPLGWKWLKRPGSRRSWSWPLIWLRLWEYDPASRDRLTAMAVSWFDGQRTHHGEAGIYWPASEAWLKVWPEAAGVQRLVAWGKAFLEDQSKNRDWQAVALVLWTMDPRPPDLRDVIRKGLAANPEDTSDWDIAQLVEDRP